MANWQIDIPGVATFFGTTTDSELGDMLATVATEFRDSGGCWMTLSSADLPKHYRWVPNTSSVSATFDDELPPQTREHLRLVG